MKIVSSKALSFALVVCAAMALAMPEVWAQSAHRFERVGEWIDRIGWKRFFELTGIEFTKHHIDDFKHAGLTYHTSAHVRF